MLDTNSQLSYQRIGTGQPVYFLHGLALDSHSMSAVYERILKSNSYEKYYIDLPGMGSSRSVEGIHSSVDVVNRLADFIKSTSRGRSVVLVGHSYGGYLCYELACQLRCVKWVFATCPVIIADERKRRVASHKNIITGEMNVDKSTSFTDYVSTNVLINPETWRQYQHSILPGLRSFNRPFWDEIQQTGRYVLPDEAEIPHRLNNRNVQIHTLLGQMDNVVGYENQAKMLRYVAGSCVAVVEHAGHNLPIDAFGAVESAWHHFKRMAG